MSRRGRGAPWAGLFLVARAEWRVRWRSHVLLAGIVAVTLGAVVATLTASGRSETAFRRLRVATRASDVIIGHPKARTDPAAAVAAVAAIEGVQGAEVQAELFVRPFGTDLFPDYNLFPVAPLAASSAMNAPVLRSGRAVDPARADEMVVSEDLAAVLSVKVGDVVTLESMTAHWVDVSFNGGDAGPPDGPKVKVKVVGVGRTPGDFGRVKGILYLSPAFVAKYGDRMQRYTGVHVRLSEAKSRQARDGVLRGLDKGVEMSPSPFADNAATDDGLGTIAAALRLIAVAAVLAGIAVSALVLARLTRLVLRERETLVAFGWTTRDSIEVAMLACGPALVAGVLLGVAGGVIASSRAMVGLAQAIDPTPNTIVVDTRVVVGAAAVAVVVGLLVVGLIAGRVGIRRHERTHARGRSIPMRRPLPLFLGARHALVETGNGGRASRGALVVLAVGLAGAIAALTVSASIAQLQTDPSLSGQGGGRSIDSGESVKVYDRAMPLLEKDARVAMLAGVHVIFGISSAGTDELTALAYDIRRGDLGASIVRGRIAQQPDEVALGPATLDQLDKKIGDTIQLRHEKRSAEFRIVGATLFPEGDFKHDAGVALAAGGADRLVGNAHDAGAIHSIAFEWADNVDARAADAKLKASGLNVFTAENAVKPASVTNLGQVQTLPRFLAALLILLAVVTIGHALTSSVRMRSRELGTLQALGMTPAATSAIVAAQALTIITIAAAIGIPLGGILGARIWAPIAERAHVVVLTATPWPTIAMYITATIATIALFVAAQALHARRLHPSDTLHTQ